MTNEKEELIERLYYIGYRLSKDGKESMDLAGIAQYILDKYELKRATPTLVPLDKEKLLLRLLPMRPLAGCFNEEVFKTWKEFFAKISEKICEEFAQPARKEISVDWNEIESLVSLKLKQMLVDDSPDRLGYTKSKIIIEAIKQYIDGKE